MNKPRVAFFSFTSCEGCQLTVLSIEESLLDLLSMIEVVNFREIMTEKSDEYDIAFIEGSCSREAEIAKIKKIREQSRIVIGLGACATTGGVNTLKNWHNLDEARKKVYGNMAHKFDTILIHPINDVITVDYFLHGCPIDKAEFVSLVKALLSGNKPAMPNYSMCVDCKKLENECVFFKGMVCLGPITRAGCNAICPTNGSPCEGCRGFVNNPNVNGHKEVLRRYGKELKEAVALYKLFGNNPEDIRV